MYLGFLCTYEKWINLSKYEAFVTLTDKKEVVLTCLKVEII